MSEELFESPPRLMILFFTVGLIATFGDPWDEPRAISSLDISPMGKEGNRTRQKGQNMKSSPDVEGHECLR